MKVVFRIKRTNPENKKPEGKSASGFTDYVLDLAPEESVLGGLLAVKARYDGSLAFRRSCGHGICGSDAMIINGEERLACKTLIKNLGLGEDGVITVEPLKGLPVQRDLMVEQKSFFDAFRSAKPYLINDEPPGEKERFQSQEERDAIDDPSKCILCASCYSACPVIRDKNPGFMGPAAIVNAARFNLDSRDKGFAERFSTLDSKNGVWPCENHYRCTSVCPRGIKVTKHINTMKARITKHTKES